MQTVLETKVKGGMRPIIPPRLEEGQDEMTPAPYAIVDPAEGVYIVELIPNYLNFSSMMTEGLVY